MKKSLYLTSILSVLSISLVSLAYMQYKIYDLQHKNIILQKENEILKKNVENLYKSFKKFDNKSYDNKEENNKNNLNQDNVPKKIPFEEDFNDFPQDFWDIDKYFDKMNKRMEQMQKQFLQQGLNGNDLNKHFYVTPWTNINLFRNFSINWNNFSYSIQSSNNKISWKISWKDKKVLKDLKSKLGKLWLKTNIDGNNLNFSWENIDINKITTIIDDYINQNYQQNDKLPWEDTEHWKKKKLIPWKDYF